MKFETQERVVTASMWAWSIGLATFTVGGVLLDSWAVMGAGLVLIAVGLAVLGALL